MVVVLAAKVVDVRGRDERAPELPGDSRDALVRLVLLGDAVLLDLEVDVLGAEDLDQVVGVAARVVGALFDETPAEARLQTAAEGDDALGVPVEELHVDGGLAPVEPLEEAGGGQLDEVAEARVGTGEKREVIALHLPPDPPVVDEVRLEPEDRLDAGGAARLVVLDRAVHHAVVGEPERRHAELGGALGESVDLCGAVQQRVLAVDVEVDGGLVHPSIMATGPDAKGLAIRTLRDSIESPADAFVVLTCSFRI